MSWLASLLALLAVLQSTLPSQPLDDPDKEARALALMREIRCVACENEPISQSGSDIAEDMRRIVREQVAEGKTDAEVREWFAVRYGDFVLFRPKADGPGGWLLWGLPFVLLVGGAAVAFAVRRSSKSDGVESIAPESVDP